MGDICMWMDDPGVGLMIAPDSLIIVDVLVRGMLVPESANVRTGVMLIMRLARSQRKSLRILLKRNLQRIERYDAMIGIVYCEDSILRNVLFQEEKLRKERREMRV